MPRAAVAGGVSATALVLLALAIGPGVLGHDVDPAASGSSAIPRSTSRTPAATARQAAETDRGFLYGRITTVDGDTYEGRLRWGSDRERFPLPNAVPPSFFHCPCFPN